MFIVAENNGTKIFLIWQNVTITLFIQSDFEIVYISYKKHFLYYRKAYID